MMEKELNILIADEDLSDFEIASEFFQNLGATVILVDDSSDILQLLETEKFILAFLSIELACLDQWQLLKNIHGTIYPIIGLIDKASSKLSDEGAMYGIDAYMVKPLDFISLYTYLPIVLSHIWSEKDTNSLESERRTLYDRRILLSGRRWYDQLKQIKLEHFDKAVINFGPFEIDNSQKVIYLNKDKVELTPKEYKLCRLLLTNHKKVMSVDQIISHVWADKNRASEEDVKQYVHLLRKKIEPDSSHPNYLQTVKGFGYIMNI